MELIRAFKHAMEGSEIFRVNVFAVINAMIDVGEADNTTRGFFNKRLKYHRKKINSTPEKDAEDFKAISSFVTGGGRIIKEWRSICAA